MNGPRGMVQKLEYAGANMRVYYRTRQGALFATLEWEWTLSRDEAWIFDSYDRGRHAVDVATIENDAAAHVAALRAEGCEHVHPVVVGFDSQTLLERERRHRERDLSAEASIKFEVEASEVYVRTCRRLGEAPE